MHLDVQDLRNFYYRSTLGRAVQLSLRSRLLEYWPEAKAQTVVGFGFAVPLLRPYLPQARRTMALMPGPQGVMPWPAGQPNISALVEETVWPLETGLVDRLILLHGLETSEHPSELLEECWRVLGPGGKAMFIVPNRAGLWSRSDKTPFGYGRPYTLGQLETQLRTHGFLPERHAAALYQPPAERPFWQKSGRLIEKIGRQMPAALAGGVFLVEASKRVHPPRGKVERKQARAPLSILDGMAEPVAKPV